MNALFGLLAWLLGLFAPSHSPVKQGTAAVLPAENPQDAMDVHIMNGNPRTVVALEDTHFRPNR